jgi:hypothetical protein
LCAHAFSVLLYDFAMLILYIVPSGGIAAQEQEYAYNTAHKRAQ